LEVDMSIRTRIFAATYDRFIAKTEAAGLAAHRAALLTGATGRTLEIGGGTGANLTHYGPAVESLTVTEPEPAMLKRLRRRAQEVAPAAMVLRAPAEDLPFDDAAFDTVVSTLTLCSVDDQRRAVGELRRVLRPGGRLLFVEHLRSDDERTARMQDRLNWLNRLVVCCDCNRPTLDTLRAAGFTLDQVMRTELPGAPPFARPLAVGSAVVVAVAA
jgi:ubiquinone/menaquinone biosynthesis C-methylase UbiE